MGIGKLARSTEKVINQVSRAAGAIAIVFLLAMMLLTVSDVFLRYAFRKPIMGNVELIEYFIVAACFLGMAWCAVKGGHVKVDLLVHRLPPRFQSIIDSITFILAMTVVPLVTWQALAQAREMQLVKRASDMLEIPAYPFYIVEAAGYALLVLVMVTLLARFISNAIKRR